MANNDLIEIQNKINEHKSNLAINLTNKNVPAQSTETFTGLIEKVKNIEGGGGSGIDWSTLTNASYMFNEESKFNTLFPTVNCDMSQVTSWNNAFYRIINSTDKDNTLKQSPIVFSYLSEHQFYDCLSLTELNTADELSASSDDIKYIFYGCVKLPLSDALGILSKVKSPCNMQYALALCGQAVIPDSKGFDNIGDISLKATNLNGFLYCCYNIKTFGNLTILSDSCNISDLFSGCSYMTDVGTIIATSLTTYSDTIYYSCNKLVRAGGVKLTGQSTDIIISSTGYFTSQTKIKTLEELTNMPISWFRYGGKNIGIIKGTSSSPLPLKRLTFSTTDTPYYSKDYAKDFSIEYCSFDRDGMVEMFNSLPDSSDVTKTKSITITGNPCVTDGTLTDEDIAIATAKGYSIIKE